MYQKISFLVLTLAVLALTGGTAFAGTIDLTAGGSGTATAAIGGSFEATWIANTPTGTGVFDPFLRIQAGGNEQGYNTSLGGPLDDKTGIFTHALNLSEVPIVGGRYEFVLDINEPGNLSSYDALLSLNQIQIFEGPDSLAFAVNPAAAADPGGTDPLLVPTVTGYTEVFRMNDSYADAATRNVIEMNFQLNNGSGSGDMALYIPTSVFGSYTGNIVFYSQFGSPRGFASSEDGFEEWALRESDNEQLPEPATLLLLGSGLVAMAVGFRRKLH